MNNFNFLNPTKIIFGKDTEKLVGEEILKYGKKVLVHSGGGSVKKIGVYDKVINSLKENNIEYIELSGVQPNPVVSLVREGIKLVRENNVDFILAVGGGSVIDSAKAIGMGALYDGDVWDFYSKKAVATKTLPVGTVLTIPAAGSESSNSSVITNPDGPFKNGCTNDITYPKFSILNPESTFSLPPYQVACGAADICAHMMERYFVNTPCVDLTDRLIEGAFKTMLEFTPKAIDNPTDYDVRAEIMWTGSIAHNNLLDTGRGGDWASHTLEHQLSAYYDIAHGAGLAIIFPAWMKFVAKKNPFKVIQFGKRVFDITSNSDSEIIDLTVKSLTEFFNKIGLKTTLSEIGIDDSKFEDMAIGAVEYRGGKVGGYVQLGFDDVLEIYNLAR